MIGNDIVDLHAASLESNWRRPGYLNKIFTLQEQSLISNYEDSNHMVWVLWSMKEAVYKANFRSNPIFEYAPFKCKIEQLKQKENLLCADVSYQNSQYSAVAQIHSEFVHSIACKFKDDYKDIKKIEVVDYPENYIDYLKENELILNTEDILKDQFGVPYLLNLKNNERFPLSISHHGRYLGIISCYNRTL